MSKGHAEQSDVDTAGKMADHVDVDAEHRPDTARRASNAGLNREASRLRVADAGQKDAPTEGYADQSLMHAVQAHVKLSAARMRAGAANIVNWLKQPTTGPAGDAPMFDSIQSEIAAVVDDLDNLQLEITHASKLLDAATLGPELAELNGAFHETWAPALNSVYARTHDQDGNLYSQYQGMSLGVTSTQDKLRFVFQAAGVSAADLKAQAGPRIKSRDAKEVQEQRDEELKDAELSALKEGMYAVEVALELATSDESKSADLTRSVEQLVHVLEPISPDHIGKIAKLPPLLKKIEHVNGHLKNSQLTVYVTRLWSKIASINTAHKQAAHHPR